VLIWTLRSDGWNVLKAKFDALRFHPKLKRNTPVRITTSDLARMLKGEFARVKPASQMFRAEQV
jgi:hypothetical protein